MNVKSVEDIKQLSDGLRGSLRQSLADPITGAIAEHDQTLIKFHGSYQQDDRDLREERRKQKLEPAYAFMIRTRTPGGVVSPAQWLKLDSIATTFAQRGLRITTRQAFQFHGVIKGQLKSTMQAINAAVIDTLAACGDVNRNIVVAANPHVSSVHREVYLQASALSTHLLPNSRAYYEIWLDDEKVADSGEEAEPLYGATYLPRKFKIGFAVPPDNDVDVFAQDLGFIAIIDERLPAPGKLLGYNVSVGGGMGATHGDPETYPRLGTVIGFVSPEQVTAVTEAVLTTQRDWGNRRVRKRARLKYTIDDRGVAAFQAEVERRAGLSLGPARGFALTHNGDRFGWISSNDHASHLTLHIPAGRIWDRDGLSHLTGMRAIAQLLSDTSGHDGLPPPEFRLTANQNLVIANVNATQRKSLDRLVETHGLDGYRRSTPARSNALACVAFPTCGLAMAEAERYLPQFLSRIEALLDRHGLQNRAINIRISGCPNGCSRPSLGEIALIGKAPGRYNLMLGADHRGQRLNALYRENIDEQAILDALDPLFQLYSEHGHIDEGFGDFLMRTDTVRVSTPIDLELLDARA